MSTMDGIDQALKAKGVIDVKMPGNEMMYLSLRNINLDMTQ